MIDKHPVDYDHVRCECGGIIGTYDRKTFTCEQCGKTYDLYRLDYDICKINPMTGWIFPVKLMVKEK